MSQGPGDLRLRSGRPAVRRPDPRHRPGAAARPPGRGARRDHPAAARRRPLRLRVRLVRAARRPAADSSRCRRRCRWPWRRRSRRRACSWPASTASACCRSPPTRRRASTPCRRSGASPRRPPRQHGSTVDRADWRVLMSFHLAEDREQARREAVHGLHRWHNEYNVWTLGRPGAVAVEDPWDLLDRTTTVRRGRRRRGGRRHARRAGHDDPPAAGDDRRLRHRARLLPTTGPTARRRCARGTCSPATSSPSCTARPATCGRRSSTSTTTRPS